MFYPLAFRPIFKERVWGGRKLESLYRKRLPAGVPIGESWEISDRPNDASVIANGPLAGKDLRWLMEHHAAELLGHARPERGHFPLLVKLLDAEEKLSLQVHPPEDSAAALGGEPKTELWYIADAAPGAELYVGLRRGVTRADFERALAAGTVADCFHRIEVRAGDVMFLPSGRVHGLGAGLVIFEIQQNSDTTYRVFDWNRLGLDGKSRELHIEQSLASINFSDFEPALLHRESSGTGSARLTPLVQNRLFNVELCRISVEAPMPLPGRKFQIIGVLTGELQIRSGEESLSLGPGGFGLVPASVAQAALRTESRASFLRVEAGTG